MSDATILPFQRPADFQPPRAAVPLPVRDAVAHARSMAAYMRGLADDAALRRDALMAAVWCKGAQDWDTRAAALLARPGPHIPPFPRNGEAGHLAVLRRHGRVGSARA